MGAHHAVASVSEKTFLYASSHDGSRTDMMPREGGDVTHKRFLKTGAAAVKRSLIYSAKLTVACSKTNPF